MSRAYGSTDLDIADYGYLLRKHPLEVWCAGELIQDPDISWDGLLKRSKEVRQRAYSWLFKTQNRKAQDLRLRVRIEEDAFERMTPYWQRLGFPFERLVPSLATSIGSSSDRPAALAELMGIIVNTGVARPAVSMKKLHFAVDTPYHTVFELSPREGKRVMAAPVAQALQDVLKEVVDKGTGRRVKGVFSSREEPLIVGGKTGSGDNRLKKMNRHGRLISSEAKNRTATFAFYIGDRYFGVITAFVTGPETKEYRFTSALPVAIFRLLAPAIDELIGHDGMPAPDDDTPTSDHKTIL